MCGPYLAGPQAFDGMDAQLPSTAVRFLLRARAGFLPACEWPSLTSHLHLSYKHAQNLSWGKMWTERWGESSVLHEGQTRRRRTPEQ